MNQSIKSLLTTITFWSAAHMIDSFLTVLYSVNNYLKICFLKTRHPWTLEWILQSRCYIYGKCCQVMIYILLPIRPFQVLFLFPVLLFTENLPSLQEKKTNPQKKNEVYLTEIIGILQLTSLRSELCQNGSSDLLNCVTWVLRSAELCLAREKLQDTSFFLVSASNLMEQIRI